MSCENICAKVLNDITHSCDVKPIGGLEQTIKLINRCDINLSDWTIQSTTVGGVCSHKVTEFVPEDPADLNAVTVQGIPGKRLLNATFSSSNSDFGVYYTHTVSLFAQGMTDANLCNIKALGSGAEVIAIVEQRFKGANGESAFMVYGWNQGLKLADFTFDHNENNGGAVIPLSSTDPDLEPDPPMTLLMTDYETTKAFFNSL